MPAKDWTEVIDKEFSPVDKVTVDMQAAAFKQVRLMRGSVRLMLGRLLTSEELEERRVRAQRVPLR